mgnify:CR=1 FL=1|jgi:hypothetical protein
MLANVSGNLSRPHIAYFDDSAKKLKWAYRDDPGWMIEEVADMSDTNGFTSIAVDSDNNPHILFSGGTNCYAYRELGVWYMDKPIQTTGGGSLGLDDDDVPHIAFNRMGEFMVYATLEDGEWVETDLQELDRNEKAGVATDIVLDHDGNPHISYINTTTKMYRHAWYEPEPQ